jgi:AAA domain, putative AbiEii toxin, Type IV TA system/AAA ATPase domain
VITRIEIDGFKSFVDFELELKPFTVLAGANNSGKSNLLDAILLLKALFRGDSGALVRRAGGGGRGGSTSLFHRVDEETGYDHFRVGARCLGIPESNAVDVGRSGKDNRALAVGLDLGRENDVSYLPFAADRLPYSLESGDSVAAQSARWTQLQPVPAQMRLGADISDNLRLSEDCGNLAAVVARIGAGDGFEDFHRDAVYVLPQLTDVRAHDFRAYWDLRLTMRGGRIFSPAEVSDGTLRVLAILAALHDPDYPAVLLIEELENGLDPRYLGRLVRRILARLERTEDTQVIVTTHSPVLVGETKRLSPESVYLLGIVGGPREYEGVRKSDYYTHARKVIVEGERGTFVPPPELRDYLSPVGEL